MMLIDFSQHPEGACHW